MHESALIPPSMVFVASGDLLVGGEVPGNDNEETIDLSFLSLSLGSWLLAASEP